MALVIGVTGGIASGKSTATDFFASRGVPVLDADVIAREVVQPGSAALAEIRDAFGGSVITASGALNRAALREIVFSDPARRKILERITHPRIHAVIRDRLAQIDAPWAVLSVPLLVDSPLLTLIDRVLVIDTEPQIQQRRVESRDRVDAAQARAIMAAQASRERRLEIADDVIENRDDLDTFIAHLTRLANRYDQIAARDRPAGQPPDRCDGSARDRS